MGDRANVIVTGSDFGDHEEWSNIVYTHWQGRKVIDALTEAIRDAWKDGTSSKEETFQGVVNYLLGELEGSIVSAITDWDWPTVLVDLDLEEVHINDWGLDWTFEDFLDRI